MFLKWNNVRYASLNEVRSKAPALKHAVLIDVATTFASAARAPEEVAAMVPNTIDLRLAPGSNAVDGGQYLPGLNDGFRGKAPDLGAYELDDPLPHYGPRAPG